MKRVVPHQQPIAGHGFRVGLAQGPRQRVQLGHCMGVRPAMLVRLSQPTPPDLIRPAQGPSGMLLGTLDQTIAPVFFRI